MGAFKAEPHIDGRHLKDETGVFRFPLEPSFTKSNQIGITPSSFQI